MEELTRELRNLTGELRELRAKTEQNIEELRIELKNSTQTIEELKQLIGSTDCEKGAGVDNTKRPLFKRIKGIFSSRKSKKKKKKKGHSTEHEVDDDDDIPNILATSHGSQMRRTRGSKKGSEVSDVDDYDDIPTVHAGRQIRLRRAFERGFDVSDVDDDDDISFTFGGRQMRRTRGSKSGSDVSVGIFFSGLQGPPRKLSFDDCEELYKNNQYQDTAQTLQDSDKEVEPIEIIEHPQSQTAKEGSKVELKCKAQGKRSTLLYQWRKDDGSVLGENEASLVLESVKLRDFGRYTCYVGYIDTYEKYEKSSPAILDVIPQNLNGTRPKLLQELDINTRDEIASLLENRRSILGGCRRVAATYDMKDYQIEALNNSKEPGKDVLEFLMASKPNLTVYNFCKVLTKFERFDIVKKLEEHFLIWMGNEIVI